jgi:hypothetical protein
MFCKKSPGGNMIPPGPEVGAVLTPEETGTVLYDPFIDEVIVGG